MSDPKYHYEKQSDGLMKLFRNALKKSTNNKSAKNPHFIVGPNRMCLCGQYDGINIFCADILKACTVSPKLIGIALNSLVQDCSEPASSVEPKDESSMYDIEDAICIAELWRAGKMIGGDEDAVRDALLAEVERLRNAQPPEAVEQFVVKHYSEDDRPSIKGNGFDGLEIGKDRQEAGEFVAWVNARLASPLSKGEVVEWQPIETAPKDGANILLGYYPEPAYEGASVHKSCEVAFWHGIYQKWCSRVLLNAEGAFAPTHWKPLPLPPVTKTGA